MRARKNVEPPKSITFAADLRKKHSVFNTKHIEI